MRQLSIVLLTFFCTCFLFRGYAQMLDFSEAVIVSLEEENSVSSAARVLQEVVEERSHLKLSLEKKNRPDQNAILIGSESVLLERFPEIKEELASLEAIKKEGFKVISLPDQSKVVIAGRDQRGMLYGVGYLLRKSECRDRQILIPEQLKISSSPKYPIRGHQLGYRPKTNAYDAWTVGQFDRYIRDLALFGANSIEIMPDKTDDDFENSHMVLPAIEMIGEQSKLAKKYGMDLWMWYPNMGTDYTNPDSIQKELEEHERIFKAVPHLDHLFVPGGDPGDLEPKIQFAWLKKLVKVLHTYHPEADIWVSPQVFRPSEVWFDSFYEEVNKKYDWFGGVVYGPWVKETIREVRQKVDQRIPIRRYPDITHTLLSQFPVPEWDLAWAIALDREPYNPRPVQEKHIHNLFAEYGAGSISYSEGINDDVNKFVWSAQDWDPETPVKETLREYARLFIGPDYSEAVAEALIGLENNFREPLLINQSVRTTFSQWKEMERDASPEVKSNYRFQMGLLRAYYDAHTQRRLLYETALEQEAVEALESAGDSGTEKAFEKARTILEKAKTKPVGEDLYRRIMELKDSVFKSIGYQVTREEPQFGEDGRGNYVDYISVPLNDSEWLLEQMDRIEKLPSEKERLVALEDIIHRTDPGPGGYYTNLGSFDSWEHVVRQKTWEEDPSGLESPIIDFGANYQEDEWVEIFPKGYEEEAVPQAWMTQVTALYETPLVMEYGDLDTKATYKIRVAYTGRFNSHLKLTANNGYVIHDSLQVGQKPVYEFDIPKEVTSEGKIKLTWTCLPGERGTQVAELWLIKK